MMRYALDDFDPRCGKSRNFVGIVGEQPDARLAEQREHLRGGAKVARINRKAEPEIGIDSVKNPDPATHRRAAC